MSAQPQEARGKHPHSTATARPHLPSTAAPCHFWVTSSRTHSHGLCSLARAGNDLDSSVGFQTRSLWDRRGGVSTQCSGGALGVSPHRRAASFPHHPRTVPQAPVGSSVPRSSPALGLPTLPPPPGNPPSAAAGLSLPSCLGTPWETPTHCSLHGGQPSLHLPVPTKL